MDKNTQSDFDFTFHIPFARSIEPEMSTLGSPSIPDSAGPGKPEARGMFTLDDGRREGVTFALVTSLFLR